MQVSAGLEVGPGVDGAALSRFADDVYLHQVIADDGGRWVDLPEALAAPRAPSTWRIHFHVPIFREQLGPFRSTQPYLRALLPMLAGRAAPPHLEVETYTWDVLPEEHRREDVADAIARELSWTAEHV